MCSDPERGWYPQRVMCYAEAAKQLTVRRVHAKHQGNEPGTRERHPMDGMTVWASEHDLTPEDDFV